MPELPEVETVRRGIEPLIRSRHIESVVCRVPKLRWELCRDLHAQLAGQTILSVRRRAKYIMIELERGCLVVHLGMTGILRVLDADREAGKHDHFDLVLDNGKCLRLNDSRRFGAVFYVDDHLQKHARFKDLGPEPLSEDFNGAYLYRRARKSRGPIKNLIMNQRVVVGVGNIYACESLFRAGIDPRRSADRISRVRFDRLTADIKAILEKAIEMGGTTIRDFEGSDGKPGYFRQELAVYGREGKPCVECSTPVKNVRLAGRSTFYCPKCQR